MGLFDFDIEMAFAESGVTQLWRRDERNAALDEEYGETPLSDMFNADYPLDTSQIDDLRWQDDTAEVMAAQPYWDELAQSWKDPASGLYWDEGTQSWVAVPINQGGGGDGTVAPMDVTTGYAGEGQLDPWQSAPTPDELWQQSEDYSASPLGMDNLVPDFDWSTGMGLLPPNNYTNDSYGQAVDEYRDLGSLWGPDVFQDPTALGGRIQQSFADTAFLESQQSDPLVDPVEYATHNTPDFSLWGPNPLESGFGRAASVVGDVAQDIYRPLQNVAETIGGAIPDSAVTQLGAAAPLLTLATSQAAKTFDNPNRVLSGREYQESLGIDTSYMDWLETQGPVGKLASIVVDSALAPSTVLTALMGPSVPVIGSMFKGNTVQRILGETAVQAGALAAQDAVSGALPEDINPALRLALEAGALFAGGAGTYGGVRGAELIANAFKSSDARMGTAMMDYWDDLSPEMKRSVVRGDDSAVKSFRATVSEYILAARLATEFALQNPGSAAKGMFPTLDAIQEAVTSGAMKLQNALRIVGDALGVPEEGGWRQMLQSEAGEFRIGRADDYAQGRVSYGGDDLYEQKNDFLSHFGLAGSKPRYRSFQLEFDDDALKAAYVLTSRAPSKERAAFQEAMNEALGYDRAKITEIGQAVRAALKSAEASGVEPGTVLRVRAMPGGGVMAVDAANPDDLAYYKGLADSAHQYMVRLDGENRPSNNSLMKRMGSVYEGAYDQVRKLDPPPARAADALPPKPEVPTSTVPTSRATPPVAPNVKPASTVEDALAASLADPTARKLPATSAKGMTVPQLRDAFVDAGGNQGAIRRLIEEFRTENFSDLPKEMRKILKGALDDLAAPRVKKADKERIAEQLAWMRDNPGEFREQLATVQKYEEEKLAEALEPEAPKKPKGVGKAAGTKKNKYDKAKKKAKEIEAALPEPPPAQQLADFIDEALEEGDEAVGTGDGGRLDIPRSWDSPNPAPTKPMFDDEALVGAEKFPEGGFDAGNRRMEAEQAERRAREQAEFRDTMGRGAGTKPGFGTTGAGAGKPPERPRDLEFFGQFGDDRKPGKTPEPTDKQFSPKPPGRTKLQWAGEIFNAPRTFLTTADFSGGGRQGWTFIGMPGTWATGVEAQAVSFASKGQFDKIDAGLRARKYWNLKREAGLHYATLGTDLTKREEAITSSIFDNVPLISNSNRAYTAALNYMRDDAFDKMWSVLAPEHQTEKTARKIAAFLNAASGRGSLKGKMFVEGAPLLNAVFFAPRYFISRAEFPVRGAMLLLNGGINNRVKADVARMLTGWIAMNAGILAIGEKAGMWEVDWTDPTSSNWGQIRIGPTHIDPWAGYRPLVNLVARMTEAGINKDKGLAVDSGVRFTRSKLAPIPGEAWTQAEGKDITGTPVSENPWLRAGTAAAHLGIPIASGEIIQAYKDFGLKHAALASVGTFGFGASVYETPRDKADKIAKGFTYTDRNGKKYTFESLDDLRENEAAYAEFSKENEDELEDIRYYEDNPVIDEKEQQIATLAERAGDGDMSLGEWREENRIAAAELSGAYDILLEGTTPRETLMREWNGLYDKAEDKDGNMDFDKLRELQVEWMKDNPDRIGDVFEIKGNRSAGIVPTTMAYINFALTYGKSGNYFDIPKHILPKAMGDWKELNALNEEIQSKAQGSPYDAMTGDPDAKAFLYLSREKGMSGEELAKTIAGLEIVRSDPTNPAYLRFKREHPGLADAYDPNITFPVLMKKFTEKDWDYLDSVIAKYKLPALERPD